MFTGIVEETGQIESKEESADGTRLQVSWDAIEGLEHGTSISVSGVCLTVEDFGEGWFEVFVSQETLYKTYLGELDEGDVVNLERALRANDRLDGHFVQGHVDTTTRISRIERVGDDWEYGFEMPNEYSRYIVSKGSVALDGISLTVAEVTDGSFSVAIIPTTREITNLSEKEVGDEVNVEIDVIAKYVESMMSERENS